MALLEKIQKDMVEAMKAKDEARLSTIRMIKAALQKYSADNPGKLNEDTEQQVLKTLAKQRQDSIEAFRNAGRAEAADKEAAELKLIETYMPQLATGEEMDAAVAAAIAETGATSAKQMGLVMKAAQARLAGKRADGKALSEKVKGRLG
jgi:hypothetical protein